MTTSIYTDGACCPNPGSGGWGWLIMNGPSQCGGEPNTTNNRMELTAILKALQAQPDGSRPIINSDSLYCIKGCTTWRAKWEKTNFKGGKIVNTDLWRAIHRECDRVGSRFNWVKGHTGNIGNEAADQLAERGRREFADIALGNTRETQLNDQSSRPADHEHGTTSRSPCVDALIDAYMKRYPATRGMYFQEVHQALAPMARAMEIALIDILDEFDRVTLNHPSPYEVRKAIVDAARAAISVDPHGFLHPTNPE